MVLRPYTGSRSMPAGLAILVWMALANTVRSAQGAANRERKAVDFVNMQP